MPISQSLKEVYASAPTSQRYIETLTFSHSTFPSYNITNDNRSWRFLIAAGQSVDFLAMPFKIVLPKTDNKGNQDMALTVANIGRELIDPLEAAIAIPSEPVRCIYRVYLNTPNTLPQNTPPLSLIITGVSVTRESVSATATRADILNRAFPYNFYKFSQFPGLRR